LWRLRDFLFQGHPQPGGSLKGLFICVIALFFYIAMPWAFGKIDATLSHDYHQNVAGVTTAAGEYAANVTLSKDLWNDNSASVTEISSNVSVVDSPTAYSFNTVSRILTVSGLEQNLTRTLALTFRIDNPYLPDFLPPILWLFRYMYIVLCLGLDAAAVYAFFQN